MKQKKKGIRFLLIVLLFLVVYVSAEDIALESVWNMSAETTPGLTGELISEPTKEIIPEPTQSENAEPGDEEFVMVTEYIQDIVTDLRYATEDNFVGEKIYDFTQAWLRYGTVKKLRAAQDELKRYGYRIKIWDAFRPVSAQFRLWEKYPDSAYVSNPEVGYSSHSRGNTVDITLVYEDGGEVWMPTGFDDFSAKADRDYSDCEQESADHAILLENIMEKNGFKLYQKEWWHYMDTTAYPVEEIFEPSKDTQENEKLHAKKSILDLLKTAMQPVGQTMYVWGGGWNEADTGAGKEAVTLGISENWKKFSDLQDSSYDYRNTRYQIHDGLDCSGYIGWTVYNILENENDKEGYVFSATQIAEVYAELGLGTYIPASDMKSWQAGDIMSMKGHVWMVVGCCEDGSVLMLHASPPGVGFYGTASEDGSRSEAIELAEYVMKTYYPKWYERYPNCARSHSYLTDSSAMRWSREILSDDETLADMSAAGIVELLFESE